jgi:hypothetical protein
MLTLAETIPGLVADHDWGLDMEALGQHLSGATTYEEFAATYAEIERARTRSREQAADRRFQRENLSLEVTGYRAALDQRFRESAQQLQRPPWWSGSDFKEAAAAARKKLGRLGEDVAQAGNLAALERLEELGQPIVVQARSLKSSVDARAKHRNDAISALKRNLSPQKGLAPHHRSVRADLRHRIDGLGKLEDGEPFETELHRVEEQVRDFGHAVQQDADARTWAQTVATATAERKKAHVDRRSLLLKLRDRKTTRKGENVPARLVQERVLWRQGTAKRTLPRAASGTPGPSKGTQGSRSRRRPRFWQPGPPRIEAYYADAEDRTYWEDQLSKWGSRDVRSVIEAAIRQERL